MREDVKPPQRVIPMRSIEGNAHISEVGGRRIDVFRLIHLTQHVIAQETQTESFRHQMNEACWVDSQGNPVPPARVVRICREAGGYAEAESLHPVLAKHIRAIRDADYSHPLMVFEGMITDGMHRLAKAELEDKRTVPVKFLEEIPAEALIEQ